MWVQDSKQEGDGVKVKVKLKPIHETEKGSGNSKGRRSSTSMESKERSRLPDSPLGSVSWRSGAMTSSPVSAAQPKDIPDTVRDLLNRVKFDTSASDLLKRIKAENSSPYNPETNSRKSHRDGGDYGRYDSRRTPTRGRYDYGNGNEYWQRGRYDSSYRDWQDNDDNSYRRTYDTEDRYSNRYETEDGTYRSRYDSDDRSYSSRYDADGRSYRRKYDVDDQPYTSRYDTNDRRYISKYEADDKPYLSKYDAADKPYSSKYDSDYKPYHSRYDTEDKPYRSKYESEDKPYRNKYESEDKPYRNKYGIDDKSYRSINDKSCRGKYDKENKPCSSKYDTDNKSYRCKYDTEDKAYPSKYDSDDKPYRSKYDTEDKPYRRKYSTDDTAYRRNSVIADKQNDMNGTEDKHYWRKYIANKLLKDNSNEEEVVSANRSDITKEDLKGEGHGCDSTGKGQLDSPKSETLEESETVPEDESDIPSTTTAETEESKMDKVALENQITNVNETTDNQENKDVHSTELGNVQCQVTTLADIDLTEATVSQTTVSDTGYKSTLTETDVSMVDMANDYSLMTKSETVRQDSKMAIEDTAKDISELTKDSTRLMPDLTKDDTIKDVSELPRDETVREVPQLMKNDTMRDVPELTRDAIGEVEELANENEMKKETQAADKVDNECVDATAEKGEDDLQSDTVEHSLKGMKPLSENNETTSDATNKPISRDIAITLLSNGTENRPTMESDKAAVFATNEISKFSSTSQKNTNDALVLAKNKTVKNVPILIEGKIVKDIPITLEDGDKEIDPMTTEARAMKDIPIRVSGKETDHGAKNIPITLEKTVHQHTQESEVRDIPVMINSVIEREAPVFIEGDSELAAVTDIERNVPITVQSQADAMLEAEVDGSNQVHKDVKIVGEKGNIPTVMVSEKILSEDTSIVVDGMAGVDTNVQMVGEMPAILGDGAGPSKLDVQDLEGSPQLPQVEEGDETSSYMSKRRTKVR